MNFKRIEWIFVIAFIALDIFFVECLCDTK